MKEEDIQALNIIKKRIRHFKKLVEGPEKINFCIWQDFSPEEFNILLN